MNIFDNECEKLFNQMGNGRKMVLSTSLNDKVTSRTMSVVIINKHFYFQTDKNFRKYEYLLKNPNTALCFENVQIEGISEEIGYPSEQVQFLSMYKKNFKNSYENYSFLESERLFVVKPVYIQKWIYENGKPFIEKYCFEENIYKKEKYVY